MLVAGIIRRDGRVLLGHRRPDRDHYPDVWDLPGGHIEEHELPADALVRELGEELGIVPRIEGDTPWTTLTADGVQLHVYLIDSWLGEPRNMAPDEHDRLSWVGPEELSRLDLAHPRYVRLLGQALS